MTRDEAFGELGLDAEATPDQIRRAYARGVKTRKPEVDPDGFRRLREAYEQLSERRSASAPRLVVETPRRTEDEAPEEPNSDPRDDPAPPPPSSWLELADQGEHAEAARLALAAMERADARLDFETPSAWHILELILFLQERGAVPESKVLHDRLQQRLATSGSGPALLGRHGMTDLLFLRELLQLKPTFPAAVRAAIARAVRVGDLDSALPELEELCRTQQEAVEKACAQLRLMPTLGPVFRPALQPIWPPPPPPPPPPAWTKTVNPQRISEMISGFFTVAILVTFAVSFFLDHDKPPVPKEVEEPVDWAAHLHEEIRSTCRSAPTEPAYFFCLYAPEALHELEAGHCEEADRKLKRAHHWSDGDTNLDPWIKHAEFSLSTAILRHCS